LDLNKIKQYYYDGWGAIHDYGDIAVVISDAFRDPTDWNGFMSSGFKNVILDTHLYQVFSAGQLAMDIGAHVSSACGIGKQLGGVDKWTVIGEWSGALTDVSPPPPGPPPPHH
jgi:glucan 1,3-beta-glucosidase